MSMTHNRRIVLGLIALFVSVSGVWAQTGAHGSNNPYGLILYAEGSDLTVYRDGTLTDYDLSSTDVIGLPLFAGDLIQTGPGTLVELQLEPTRTQLKVAENTTFRIQSLGTAGTAQVDLTYGRIRAKVERFAATVSAQGEYPFSVRGLAAVAGVRGTDFGFDYVAGTDGSTVPVTRIYCFDGTVDVNGINRSEESGREAEKPGKTMAGTVVIRADEMVTIASVPVQEESGKPAGSTPIGNAHPEAVFQTDTVSSSVTQFWNRYDFQAQPISPEAAERRFPKLEGQLGSHYGATVAAATATSPQIEPAAADQSKVPESAPESSIPTETSAGPGPAAPVQQSTVPVEPSTVTAKPAAAPVPNPIMLPSKADVKVAQNVYMGVAIGGATLSIAGAGLYFFGTAIFPGMSSQTNGSLSNGLLITGGSLFGCGIIAYLISLATAK
ncbi:MAG TPA: FecR domain-containing protein [Spirochaetia bacterium]|nr:FecR domain-containing protein [Spirochaetia bacterium]